MRRRLSTLTTTYLGILDRRLPSLMQLFDLDRVIAEVELGADKNDRGAGGCPLSA